MRYMLMCGEDIFRGNGLNQRQHLVNCKAANVATVIGLFLYTMAE